MQEIYQTTLQILSFSLYSSYGVALTMKFYVLSRERSTLPIYCSHRSETLMAAVDVGNAAGLYQPPADLNQQRTCSKHFTS